MNLPEDFGNTFITLNSKKKLYLATFTPADIKITDIVHALSGMSRYGNQGKFYSVAQHCVLMSRMVSKENALWALLHDAAEAYIGDMIYPLKCLLPEYRQIEKYVFDIIKVAFNLPGEEPEEVKLWDRMILHEEAKVVLGIDPVAEDWELPLRAAVMPEIKLWHKGLAKKLFLKRYTELTGISA